MAKKRKYEELYTTEAAKDTIYKMIYNLGPSVFRWRNVPDGHMPPSELTEKLLMQRGHIAAFNTNIGLWVGQATLKGTNSWGFKPDGQAEPLVMGANHINHDRSAGILPIVLYDQPNHQSIISTTDWYINSLGKLRQAIEASTRWLKTPMIFRGGEEQAELIYDLVMKIEQGVPAVAIKQGSFDVGSMEITPTNISPAILDALHMSYERIEAKLFEELGVPDYNTQKMAQQTSTEILLPMLAVALKTVQRLYMRNEWADKVNAIYGYEILCECLSLGLIKQSIFSSTGYNINFDDLNNNGIPDKSEVNLDGE